MTNKFPVPQETVEAGLLHAVNQDMERWLEVSRFESDDFSTHRQIFLFFHSHLEQYGSLPTGNEISSRFEWQPPVGEFGYWLTEMKRYSMARRVMTVIQQGYEKVADPEEALNLMLNNLSMIRSSQSNHVKASDAEAMERLERFDLRTEHLFNSKTQLGLRTGMKIYDDSKVGWLPGSLVGMYSRPGLGKTWWLLWEGVITWMNGGTILAITPEMPANMLDYRIDTIVAAEMGHPLDYTKVLLGDPAVRKEYALVAEAMAQTSRWWTYDSLDGRAVGVSDISALVRQHKPNMVLIDGISLLRKEGRGQTWEQMHDMVYGLKNLATISEIPFLINHQAVNSARGRRGADADIPGRGDDFHMPTLNDAAYGDSFVGACSDVITMCAEPTSKHINWYSIRKYRERGWDTLDSRYGLGVDFRHGKIVDFSQHGYDPVKVGNDVRNQLGVL